jgi:iron complex outermembrane receptor protein
MTLTKKNKNFVRAQFVFATLLASSTCALAGSDPASDENPFLDDMPIVLSASRLAQPISEAPVAMTIIDHQMIIDSGAWDLSEVMRLVPGMYVAYHSDRFYSTDDTVAYHGLVTNSKSDRMQVLVDGRSVYSSLYGGVIWGDIPVVLSDIERIEVVRGPDSVTYGANSFSGVINIITRHPEEAQGEYASATVGNGRDEGVMHYGGKYNDLTYRFTASTRKDDGEETTIQNPPSETPWYWGYNKFDNKLVHQFNFLSDYQIDSTNNLEFQIGYNGGPRQEGEAHDIYSDDKNANNYFEMIHWRKSLDDNGELMVQVYNSIESNDGHIIDTDGSSNIGETQLRRRELEVQHTFSPSDTTRLVWGGSIRQDAAYAPWILGINTQYWFPTEYYDLKQLFSNLEWHALPDLLFNVGAMMENNNYTGTSTTPRIATNWHFLPGQPLRVGYSEGTRSPSMYEEMESESWRYQQTANSWISPGSYPELPQLVPEHVRSSEIAYLGQFSDVFVDLRLFHDHFTQLIDVEQRSAEAGNLNAGSALSRGVELALKVDIDEQTRLIYNITYGGVQSNNVDEVMYSYSMPQSLESLMLTHRFNEQWDASLMGYLITETHFNETDWDFAENRSYFIPGNNHFDVRVAHNFQVCNKHGVVALIVQDVMDTRYFEYRHDNQVPGRNTRINLSMDF